MSTESVLQTTCDLCLRSATKDEDIKFYGYQDVDICQFCCFVLDRADTFSRDTIEKVFSRYRKEIIERLDGGIFLRETFEPGEAR